MLFESDCVNPCIICALIDKSGSMQEHEVSLVDGLNLFKKQLLLDSNHDDYRVAFNFFSCDVELGEYTVIENIEVNYKAGGYTVLYAGIRDAAKKLLDVITKVENDLSITPKVMFVTFSDGVSERDSGTFDEAQKAINDLKMEGVETVFCAFGSGVSSSFGEQIGFSRTIEITETGELTNFLGNDLSSAFSEFSQSMSTAEMSDSLSKYGFSASATSSNFSATAGQNQSPEWYDDF